MADGAQSRSEIRRLLSEHDLHPKKHFGQNFLTDQNIVRRIAEAAAVDGRDVVEIGPGTGTLTAELAVRARSVVAYEIDEALQPALDEALGSFGNVEVRYRDVAKVDLCDELGDGPWTLVANLPYNVGTGIVLDALQGVPTIDRFVVMVQQEVADRMLATKGSKTYGIPSVVVGLHAVGHVELTVPPQVFEPAPRVDSAVVVLDRIAAPANAGRAIELATAGFGQRRKMLRRSLSTIVEAPAAMIERAGFVETMRAEELDPIDYVALARAEEQV